MHFLTPEKALIFRIVHIANVPWILRNGIHCRSAPMVDPGYREIGNPDLISKRAGRTVPIPPGGGLSDYVPFYFTPRSPMLLNIKTGFTVAQLPMSEIVVLVSSLPRLAERGIPFVFSDRHAYLATATFSDDLTELDRIDWPRLQQCDFKRDPDEPAKFERYQAEALAYRHVPVAALLGLACSNSATDTRLANEIAGAGISLPTVVRPNWFF
jgi:hypothetical protein